MSSKQLAKKQIIIEVCQGLVDVVKNPTDCEIILQDYDIDTIYPESKKGRNGKRFNQSVIG